MPRNNSGKSDPIRDEFSAIADRLDAIDRVLGIGKEGSPEAAVSRVVSAHETQGRPVYTHRTVNDRLSAVERRLDILRQTVFKSGSASSVEYHTHVLPDKDGNFHVTLPPNSGNTVKVQPTPAPTLEPVWNNDWGLGAKAPTPPRTITPELLEQAAFALFLNWTTKQREVLANRLNILLLTEKVKHE